MHGLPELRTFWWVIVWTGALLLGCAGTVEHVRYNPDTLLYEGTTLEDTSRADRQDAWFAMRMPDTHELAEDISVAARTAHEAHFDPTGIRARLLARQRAAEDAA